MFELFDHTADLGIRIRAATLAELFEEAAAALFSVIVADVKTIRPERRYCFRLQGTRADELFLDWLNELLFTFSAKHILLVKYKVDISEGKMSSETWGELYNPLEHEIAMEVKAITYHGLKLENLGDHWLAEVILDI